MTVTIGYARQAAVRVAEWFGWLSLVDALVVEEYLSLRKVRASRASARLYVRGMRGAALTVALTVALTSLLLVGSLTTMTMFIGTVERLGADFCPTEGGYPQTLVFIDQSERLSFDQAIDLKRRIEILKMNLAQHENLSIFVLDPDNNKVPKPIFALCNPGTGEGSTITANPSLLHERFAGPLNTAFDQALLGSGHVSSPIMETIRSLTDILEQMDAGPKRLIILSDMIQHSPIPGFSQYRNSSIDFAEFRRLPYASAVMAPLTDVEVEIDYLRSNRLPAREIQGISHLRFWMEYFDALGAHPVLVREFYE